MGFALSVLYFLTYYLTPATLFGPVARFRVQLVLAIVLLLISLPRLVRSFVLKTPQALALAGLVCSVFLSLLIGERWLGGAVQAVLAFLPSALAYFFVCLHCTTRRRLQVVVLMFLFTCLFVIAHGAMDMSHGLPEVDSRRETPEENIGPELWNMEHPYLFAMRNGAGEWFFRLRGLGPINDPNDFAQVAVCTVPLMFIFWRRKRTIRNFIFVLVPLCLLLIGIYLTHSRGALLAVMALAIVAFRKRIGTLPALMLGGGLLAAAMALQFTGGRGISAGEGADRTALWGEGLNLLKTHPLFGVGFGRMAEHVVQTAHNSIVVCAAELGMFGLFFWTLFLYPTLRDVLKVSSIPAANEALAQPHGSTFSDSKQSERMGPHEIQALGKIMLLSLVGFAITGWFLSRAFVLTLFLLGGMGEVIYEIAVSQGLILPREKMKRVLAMTAVVAVCLVLTMYILVRILNMAR